MSNTYTVTYAVKSVPSAEWVSDLHVTVTADNDESAIAKAIQSIRDDLFSSSPYRINIKSISHPINRTYSGGDK